MLSDNLFQTGKRIDNYTRELNSDEKKFLDDLYTTLAKGQAKMAGYPVNTDFSYSEIYKFLSLHINNVGDPYGNSLFKCNTHQLEKEVIETFASFFNIAKDDVWGYVTNGGTEGNLFSIFLARERFPDGIFYYSEDTHYSGNKISRILRVPTKIIESQKSGEMDYEKLHEAVLKNPGKPAIILANIGTTAKGASDDVNMIRKTLNEAGVSDEKIHMHTDQALSGMIQPFVKHPQAFSFDDGIDSLALSGHKMIGSPLPCGVVLTKKKYIDIIQSEIEVVKATDLTITGSRSGFLVILLWYATRRYAGDGFHDLISHCISMTEYVINKFEEVGIHAFCNENSITVFIPRPSEKIIEKWQLAPSGEYAHLITMPHVTKEMVDEIVKDCKADLDSKAQTS